MNAALLPPTLDAIAELIERGDFAAAERRAQEALQALPPHAEVWRLLAIAQLQSGKADAARRSLQQAGRLDPDSVEVLCNLASIETQGGNLQLARGLLERALALAPDHVGALASLGRVRHRLGDFAGAALCFERGVRAAPGRAASWFDLANTCVALHQWAAAESHARQGLQLDPNSADGWYVLGFLFERQARLAEAAQAYRKSMELAPRPSTAHNLALVLDQLGDLEGGVRTMEYAVRLQPNLYEGLSQLVYNKRRICDWEGLPDLSARVLAAVDAGHPGIGPFALLAEDSTPAQQLRCARTFARHLQQAHGQNPAAPAMAALEPQAGAGSLRIGFVSSGFNRHPTALLVVELIERLRGTDLATVAFATTAGDGSGLRARIEHAFAEFHDVARQSPEALALAIRAARIDVLVDLDGYCLGSLPRLFALRPAPIQINWLAYPGSLGAPWYDYLIADPHLIPAQQRRHYDEKIAFLPRCYQPTDTTRSVGMPEPREALGLPANAFVFCCFNANWKVAASTFAAWMRILRDVPRSVLWLLDERPGSGAPDRLRAAARRAGIDPQRLVFAAKADHEVYLARYRHADLFLDTNPYNAHTTASDALYAGCPVLTRRGDTFASRVAASLNAQIGLDDLIVDDDEAYVAAATRLAQAPASLDAFKARLRDPGARAALFDMETYAREFASLLNRIAARARAGLPPQDISL